MPRSWLRTPTPLVLLILVSGACGDGVDEVTGSAASSPPDAVDCDLAPPDSHWSADVRRLPVHDRSGTYLASIGLDATVHADFGSGTWDGGPIGIPYTTVPGDQERVAVEFLYEEESDPGPYPIPTDAPIEGGSGSDGDRHVLVLDRDACVLYELFDAHRQDDGSWYAGSGAVFDLEDHTLRPDGWTSADAAGLPILPGLIRFDEVASGAIDHAIRVTVPRSQSTHLWPARHDAGESDPDLPPMGLRLRLRPDVDLGDLGPQARVVAEAMQRHGVIVADNGSAWFLSGVPDERWDNDDLRTLRSLTGRDFEALDASSLTVDPDSGHIATVPPEDVAAARVWGGPRTGRIETSVAISQLTFPNGATTAVLARSDGFADALAAGPLAAAWRAPVLLTTGGALSPVAAGELDRLGARDIVLAGGVAAIAEAVSDELEARGYEVTRHGGDDRFATAGELARAAVGQWRRSGDAAAGKRVLIALGDHADPTAAWPDALSGSAAGATLHRPVLLVRTTTIPSATWSALDELGATHVTVVGGAAAIAREVQEELRGAGLATSRLAGSDRYATAVEVARLVLAASRGATAVVAVTGADFPDALAAGPATVVLDAHLLLTRPSAVPAVVADHLRRLAPIEVTVAGGPAAVDDATVADLLDHAGASA